jgi:hypothetical protein
MRMADVGLVERLALELVGAVEDRFDTNGL